MKSQRRLSIDLETYSETDISLGIYKYAADPKFEILLFAYKLDDEPTRIIDLASGEKIDKELIDIIMSKYPKHAYNATFERICLSRHLNINGYLNPDSWYCSAVHASYLGFPNKLIDTCKVLKIDTKVKESGKLLINYFCKPCKPTKVNGGRTRNLPQHNPEKWEEFKTYNIGDVDAERLVSNIISAIPIPQRERDLYILDQVINDRGVTIDNQFIDNAIKINDSYLNSLKGTIRNITGIDNPNSYPQLKKWLEDNKIYLSGLSKEMIDNYIDTCKPNPDITRLLQARKSLGRTSTKKYMSAKNSASYGIIRGMFRLYGAKRTHRWSSQIVQLHNLAGTGDFTEEDLTNYRQQVSGGVLPFYNDVPDILSKLVRTAFIPRPGKKFCVIDFSAIEARVLAWLAGEKWRLDLFKEGGKLYETTAAMLFNIPFEEVTKDSPERKKGKVAELALGYGGGIGALTTMGGKTMGLSDEEMDEIKVRWRRANPSIVEFWQVCNTAFMYAIQGHTIPITMDGMSEIIFEPMHNGVKITLPSGLPLFYANTSIGYNEERGHEEIRYMGCVSQKGGKWDENRTYGGKICENITQAVARECLAEIMLRLKEFEIVLHVHDEIVLEVDRDETIEKYLKYFEKPIEWAEGLPLAADGYFSDFYKK